MEVSPQPPQHPPIAPTSPERSGVFERWFKKRRQNEGGEVSSPPQGTEQRKAPLKPEKSAPHIARNALRVLGLERPIAEPAPAQAEDLPTPPEQLQLEETVDKARFMGKATLRFVRGLLRRESTQPPSAEAETPALILRGAEHDLGSALGELEVAAEALPGHNSPEVSVAPSVAAPERGDGFAAEAATSATRPALSLAAHAAELQPLVETKEKISSALAVAGLGVIAVGATVLLAWEARRAAREQRRFEKERRKDRRLLEAQEAQLREQEEALRYLKQSQQVAAPEKPAYLRQVGEFTHQQAVVTRQVAQEVQEYAEQARPAEVNRPTEIAVPAIRRSAEILPVVTTTTPEQTKPLAKVETADIFEQAPGSSNSLLQGQRASGGTAASGGKQPLAEQIPAAPSSAPSLPSPAALRHQAMAKQQRTQFAWLAGIGLAVALALTALAYILF